MLCMPTICQNAAAKLNLWNGHALARRSELSLVGFNLFNPPCAGLQISPPALNLQCRWMSGC